MQIIRWQDAVAASQWRVDRDAVERRYLDGVAIADAGAVLHITGRGSYAVSYPSHRNAAGDGWITSAATGYELVAAALDASEDDPYGVALFNGAYDAGAVIVDHRGNLDGVVITP